MDCNEIKVPAEFSDICPFSDEVFHSEMAKLVEEPGFKHAVTYAMPNIDYDQFCQQLLKITNKRDFQIGIMHPFLEMLEHKTTAGVSCSGTEMIDDNAPNVFITNHRDIVLDASFLNINLIRQNKPTTEVAIGNNLLIYDWISSLVRLNRSFIVKRDMSKRQTFEAAQQLSGYIHFTLTQKKQSVWIAQREGRCKDSNDRTQESLIKMLALGGGKCLIQSLKEINLMPVSISYEFDPNDYLKAKEFLLKSKDPNFKKSQRDDLFSMETGLLQYKGCVHFTFTKSINEELDKIPADTDKNEIVRHICHIIDRAIHLNYRFYPCNYISYDIVEDSNRFADKYSAEEKAEFLDYVEKQLAKVDIPVDDNDIAFMRNMILTMYSNPLRNHLEAIAESVK